MYNQYLAALKKLGIEIYGFEFDLVSVVSKLLDNSDYNDAWIELYSGYLGRSSEYDIVPLGNNLYPLAEECYNALKNAESFGASLS